MPSPFPGMDPYLEAPAIWPDFHHRFATELSTVLNRSLPPPYYAQLEMRTELGIATIGDIEKECRTIIPDVRVARGPDRSGGVAVAEAPARVLSTGIAFEARLAAPSRHFFVEIRDSTRGHALVTLLEILSPSNKRPGPDRDAYAAKQSEILASNANLIEIDLHRSGRRVAPNPFLDAAFSRLDPPTYLVLISRSWQRIEPTLGYVAYPFNLRMWLPCIPIPLLQGQPEIPLDLQALFRLTFDGGPYLRGALDYSRLPDPPLTPAESTWVSDLLRARGLTDSPRA